MIMHSVLLNEEIIWSLLMLSVSGSPVPTDNPGPDLWHMVRQRQWPCNILSMCTRPP